MIQLQKSIVTLDVFKEKLEALSSEESQKVDNWLLEEVVPYFTHEGQGFEIPSGLTTGCIRDHLISRGFIYNTYHSGHQGNYTYFYTKENK